MLSQVANLTSLLKIGSILSHFSLTFNIKSATKGAAIYNLFCNSFCIINHVKN